MYVTARLLTIPWRVPSVGLTVRTPWGFSGSGKV